MLILKLANMKYLHFMLYRVLFAMHKGVSLMCKMFSATRAKLEPMCPGSLVYRFYEQGQSVSATARIKRAQVRRCRKASFPAKESQYMQREHECLQK
jgi:hypothetical protein